MPFEHALKSLAGIEMPPLIYGTAWKKEQTAELVEQAIGQGFRGIDTACQPKHYHEAGVGEGMARAAERHGIGREQIYLQSKYTLLGGQDPLQIPYNPKDPLAKQVADSFQRSLENLRTDHLDGLVLHSPLLRPVAMEEVWRAMEEIADAGGVNQLGISNCYNPEQFKAIFEMARVKPAVLQNRFYAETGYDYELRNFCDQHGVIYQSFWTLTANPHILRHPVVHHLMRQYGRTAPQILFRYLHQKGILPLTGTTSAEHMRQDLDIVTFEMAEESCQAVEVLLR